MSYVKKLTNEMILCEKESVNIIPPNFYYIVKIKFQIPQADDNMNLIAEISEIALHLAPKPIAVYYSSDTILLIFPRIECSITNNFDSQHHEFEGNHNLIVSKYVLLFSKQLPMTSNISAEIVHFETQIKIFTYLSWIIFQTSQKAMIKLSNGSITQKEIQFRTDGELKIILEKQGVIWNNINSNEKYGALIRLKRKKEKTSVMYLSEFLDARDTKKYINFLFG